MAPVICTVIATYNRYEQLSAAIESMLRQSTSGFEFEVIIVDNSPDAGHAQEWAARYNGQTCLRYMLEPQPGLSNARNVGVLATNAAIVHFMDDDAEAAPDLLLRLVEAFDEMRADVVGGRIRPVFDVPRPTWLHDRLLGNFSVVDWGGELRIAAANEWLAGANIAFRREALLAAGLFFTSLGRRGSDALLISNEESDVVGRIREAGGIVAYAPFAEVHHHIDARRLDRQWLRRRTAWQAVSDFIMQPDEAADRGPQAWEHALDILCRLPIELRNLHGLTADTDDPEQFAVQIDGIYELTTALLAGLQGETHE